MIAGKPQDHVLVQGLGEAGIRHGGEQAAGLQLLCRLQGLGEAGAERQDGDAAALLDDPALADGKRHPLFGHVDAHAFAARIAEGDGTGIIGCSGCHHMDQFRLVGGGHHHHVRQAAEISDVEGARMGRAVGAHEAGPVESESDGQVLDRHVMHDLIVGSLQERRIDSAERLVALRRHAGGKRHRMLLGDADIEGAGGEFLAEEIDAGAGRHGGRDGDDPVVLVRLLDQALAEHLGVGGGVGLGLGLGARHHVEGDDAVVLVGRRLRGRVALALLGDHVDQDRTGLGVADVLQDRQQVVEIVPVDGADIVEAELLEHGAAGPEAAGEFLGALGLLVDEFRQLLCQLLGGLADAAIGAAGDEAGEIGRHGAGRRRDGHVVVVEDDDEARMHGAGIVHGLIGHTGRHGAVADHSDDVVPLAVQIPRHGHAEAGRDRGGGMGCTEGVVFALRALGEARQPVRLAQGPDPVPAAREDLVGIGLVAHVPDQPVPGGVEHVMQRHRQLDDS